MSFFRHFALLVSITFAGMAAAETVEYGSLRHHSDIPGVLFLTGEIKGNDSFELRRAMRDQTIDLVVTASPGGNLYEGLQIAAILHDNELGTYVPEGASCESSCANIFLGGYRRLVVGELGVHQFFSDGPEADSAVRKDLTTATTQYTTAEIIGIMNQFETPPFVFEKMFGTMDIYYFKASEKPRLNVGVEDAAFTDRIAEVDAFLVTNPAVLKRAAVRPSFDVAAAAVAPQQPVSPAPTKSERMFGLDFFGMDLSPTGHRGVSLEGCDAICRANPNCAAWSYVIVTRWCWPKSGVQNVSYAQGTVSMIVNPLAVSADVFDRPFIEATGKDVIGYDIFPRGLPNTSLEQCRQGCELTASCRAFSWVAKKNWCFPKYGADLLRDQVGVISGIKRDE
jgi:hypothetical protein